MRDMTEEIDLHCYAGLDLLIICFSFTRYGFVDVIAAVACITRERAASSCFPVHDHDLWASVV